MYLYLFESDGFYKIGVANNVQRRRDDLQTGNPHRINIVAACKVEQPYHVEWYLHTIFSKLNTQSEWFRLVAEEVSLVKETFVILEKDDFSQLDTMTRKWIETVDRINAL